MPSIWAIGDIHGHLAPLDQLLRALPRGPEDVTVFLGDYIDRGPQSARVVERVMAEQDAAPDRTVLLWGNHEDLAAAHFALSAPSGIDYDPAAWMSNGGVQTLASYGVSPTEMREAPCPPPLLALFGRLQLFWRPPADIFPDLAHVVYVHAGILPEQRPEESDADILLWVREEFLSVIDRSGRLVIHGHTPVKSLAPAPDKIGIDTGIAYGGTLTALQLPERHVYEATRRGSVTDRELPAPTDTPPTAAS